MIINKKFILSLIILLASIAIVYSFFQFFFLKEVSNNFYSNYAQNVLDKKVDLIDYLVKEHESSIDLIINLDTNESDYIKNIVGGYLAYDTFSDIYIFENNETIYASSEKYGRDYRDILFNLYNQNSPINQSLYYSKSVNSFVRFREVEINGNKKQFLFLTDIKNIETELFNEYDLDKIYIIDSNGDVLYPVDYSNEFNFDSNTCLLGNEKIKGVLEYRNNILGDKCMLFVVSQKEINRSIEMGNEILVLILTLVFAFILFMLFMYIFRREFR